MGSPAHPTEPTCPAWLNRTRTARSRPVAHSVARSHPRFAIVQKPPNHPPYLIPIDLFPLHPPGGDFRSAKGEPSASCRPFPTASGRLALLRLPAKRPLLLAPAPAADGKEKDDGWRQPDPARAQILPGGARICRAGACGALLSTSAFRSAAARSAAGKASAAYPPLGLAPPGWSGPWLRLWILHRRFERLLLVRAARPPPVYASSALQSIHRRFNPWTMACPHQHHRADPCPTGYVSYAYSLEEVDQMTRELRKKSKQPIPEGASDFEKFQTMTYSAAMKGSDCDILLCLNDCMTLFLTRRTFFCII
ncbi:hypothetical protein U9M48_014657 [Paspalum notatum var. saurae]|uniref:Uncharacterized protein n=1 Tax=Paspalum notatum var. saurae TaxID=547442 RepID=A0AAQ3WKX8_PASNO